QTCTGWCDIHAKKTIVEAPERELIVLELLDIGECISCYDANMSEDYKKDIEEVYKVLVKFFKEAKGVVYIEEA
ncbi:MAG: hypothetical protein IJF07_02245, partial [Lachnospiraceae bacterium]|nr:hypothetical protein [Lachnospiraceae bacterium]